MKKVIAIASGGGHWKQLMLLRPAFEGCNVTFITTIPGLPEEQGISQFHIVPDCNKNEPFKVLQCFSKISCRIWKEKPDVVISTGAAPGILGLLVARLIGAKTIWVDSIANAQELSLGGKLSRKFAHTVLTQWPELADDKVKHVGAIF